MRTPLWTKIRQLITTWMWPNNTWFGLINRMDEIRKDIEAGKCESAEFLWDLTPVGGEQHLVTIGKDRRMT